MTSHVLPIKLEPSKLHPLKLTGLINGPAIKRAATLALAIGTALTVINQPDAVLGRKAFDLLPLVLVYVTPFVVVTLSQVLAMRQAMVDTAAGALLRYEDKWQTLLSHGIPKRAAFMGLVVGSINSAIVTSATLASGGILPFALLAQAYALPALFSLLSQTLTYRRASVAFAQ